MNVITAAGGYNIVYEVHTYDIQSWWQQLIFAPAAIIPVIVGELGPAQNTSTEIDEVSEMVTLMQTLETMQIPYAAWVFDEKCNSAGTDPELLNMLQSVPGYSGCTVGLPLIPNPPWGTAVQMQLQSAAGIGSTAPVPMLMLSPSLASVPMPVPMPAPVPVPSSLSSASEPKKRVLSWTLCAFTACLCVHVLA
jgi:hypothetical protein